jgi:catechol-2,3-dioxygenase
MIAVQRIGRATYETPDLARQFDYYTQVIGLRLAERQATGQLEAGGRRHGLGRAAGARLSAQPPAHAGALTGVGRNATLGMQ